MIKFLLPALLCMTTLFSEGTRVLVTGGAGYIGSHTCKALYECDYIPITMDTLAEGSADSVKWGPLILGDILDPDDLDEVFVTYQPEVVIHFAALRNVGESISSPEEYYTTNIAGSLNLLKAMKKYGVKKIIFSSSCTVYGEKESYNINEEEKKEPINPYAFTKHVVEEMIKGFSDAYGFQYMILRYFNAAGMDSNAGIPRLKSSMGFLIPRAVDAALNIPHTFSIFGTDYPTDDGTAIRDYIHVSDLARAHVLGLEYLQKTGKSESINLGTGNGYSVREVVDMIQEISQSPLDIIENPRREGDLGVTVANPLKSKQILGFTPNMSDLRSIIESELQVQVQQTNKKENHADTSDHQ